ncbi:MAG: hypothetical protein AB1894_07700 [Chloroflexota bacterium]
MTRKLKFPALKWRPECWWGLLLFVVLILLLVTSSVLTRDDVNGPSPWSTPAVAPSTPTPAATPGWWSSMPTPDPLYPTSTPGGAS